MNTYTTTLHLKSDTEYNVMASIMIEVDYTYHAPLSATMDCPEDPAEVDIHSVRVKTRSGEWVGVSSWDLWLPDSFWDGLLNEILDNHEER